MKTLKQIAKDYFREPPRKLSLREELNLLKNNNFNKFCKHIKYYYLCIETQMKLFDVDLKYLEEYIKYHSLYEEAEAKLKELTK